MVESTNTIAVLSVDTRNEVVPMFYVSESFITEHLTVADVLPEIEIMYAAMATGSAKNFPVVREPLGHADAVFGFKSGFDKAVPALGVKAGGYWPGNLRKGMTNHQSTVILFDPESGAPTALVRGNRLTGLRTAAASAISIKHLARPDVSSLGILGAGAQAAMQVEAALGQRRFTRLMIADLDANRSRALALMFSRDDLETHLCTAEEMARDADVIITITPSTEAIIKTSWIRPGTHLACMGADTVGKQEVDPQLFSFSHVFCDDLSQAISLGESQHAVKQRLIQSGDIVPIGEVIASRHAGRTSAEQITLFDSTGVGLQDVAAARAAVKIAQEHGALQYLD